MRLKVLRVLYDALPLSLYKPHTVTYRTNGKRLEQLHIRLDATLNPGQVAAVEQYTALIYQQALLEQRQAFCRGVQVGVRFIREAQQPFEKEME